MRIRYSQKSIISILMVFFLMVCVFFPGDVYNLKLVFWALMCFWGARAFLITYTQEDLYIFGMSIVYPILLMLWSSLLTGNIGRAISGAYSLILIVVVLVIRYYKIDYEKILMNLLLGLAVLTVGIVLLDVIGFFDVNGSNPLRNMVYEQHMGVMGKSPAYALYYKVFFNASPLLNIAIPYFFFKKRYINVLIVFLALMFSGTRANIFVSCVILCFGLFIGLKENKTNIKLRVTIGSVFAIVVLFAMPMIVQEVNSMMSTSGSVYSDTLKTNQLSSLLDCLSSPINLLFGTGFGSSFFDAGRGMYVTEAEIAWLDLLRKMGLLFFVPFVIFVMKPLKWKIEKFYKIAYIGYLLICFTNPLLISSTASVLYIYMYTMLERCGDTQKGE